MEKTTGVSGGSGSKGSSESGGNKFEAVLSKHLEKEQSSRGGKESGGNSLWPDPDAQKATQARTGPRSEKELLDIFNRYGQTNAGRETAGSIQLAQNAIAVPGSGVLFPPITTEAIPGTKENKELTEPLAHYIEDRVVDRGTFGRRLGYIADQVIHGNFGAAGAHLFLGKPFPEEVDFPKTDTVTGAPVSDHKSPHQSPENNDNKPPFNLDGLIAGTLGASAALSLNSTDPKQGSPETLKASPGSGIEIRTQEEAALVDNMTALGKSSQDIHNALEGMRGGEAGTKGAESVGDTLAGSIRDINPTKSNQNCINCVIATDTMLSGAPATAMKYGPQPLSVLEKTFGAKFFRVKDQFEIKDIMVQAGDGARGVVAGFRSSGQTGHVFNAVNQNGTIRFLDGQTGKEAIFDGYTSFAFMRIN